MLRSIPILEPALQPRRVPFAQPFQPDPSLVLWLLPQRDAKWHDYSGKGNHGTIYGAIWKPGRAGPVLDFDGTDDYVDCGNDASLNITANSLLTQEAWVKFDVVARGSGTYDRQVIQRMGTGDALMVYQESNAPIIRATAYDGTSWHDIGTSGTIEADVWYHVVHVVDTDMHYIYINGIQRAIGSKDDLYPSSGALIGGSSYALDGTIGEVRIYDRAPSAAEIARIFRAERVWYGV